MIFHGYKIESKNGLRVAVHIGYLPRRKQPCLYMIDKGKLTILAFFKSKIAAEKALFLIDIIARDDMAIASLKG